MLLLEVNIVRDLLTHSHFQHQLQGLDTSSCVCFCPQTGFYLYDPPTSFATTHQHHGDLPSLHSILTLVKHQYYGDLHSVLPTIMLAKHHYCRCDLWLPILYSNQESRLPAPRGLYLHLPACRSSFSNITHL